MNATRAPIKAATRVATQVGAVAQPNYCISTHPVGLCDYHWLVQVGVGFDTEPEAHAAAEAIRSLFIPICDEQVRAAAPDLLSALKYARRFLKPEDHDTAYVDGVIAKATGQ